MSPVKTVGQALEAIQQAKAGASAYCTNFFPVQSKLQAWVEQGELLNEVRDGAAFFLKQDRDFWHLYFCAASPASLGRALPGLSGLKTDPLVSDLIGKEDALSGILPILQANGFKPYSRLIRLARAATAVSKPEEAKGSSAPSSSSQVTLAEVADSHAILALIESWFDPYADQIPSVREIEEAIAARQIFVVRSEGVPAALLHFETQGVTSTIRYWVVGESVRSSGFGSILIRHYFASQPAVRRFILWVTADNENAVRKYQHYGYAPDGLVDHVLANEMVRALTKN